MHSAVKIGVFLMGSGGGSSLHPLIKELAEDFQPVGGKIALPDERLRVWAERLTGADQSLKKTLATQVIVIASRFTSLAYDASRQAIMQLSVLAALLIESEQRGTDGFAAGDAEKRMRQLMGGGGGPGGDPRLPADGAKGGTSLLGLLTDPSKGSDDR